MLQVGREVRVKLNLFLILFRISHPGSLKNKEKRHQRKINRVLETHEKNINVKICVLLIPRDRREEIGIEKIFIGPKYGRQYQLMIP